MIHSVVSKVLATDTAFVSATLCTLKESITPRSNKSPYLSVLTLYP